MLIKYSVIVATYNIDKYIDQCISSIYIQNNSNVEIIIVNDGSSDKSLEYAQKWAEKDNKIIILDKRNGGLSSARNYGMKYATGDYVMFVDGDDWVGSELFQKTTEHLNKVGPVDILCFAYSLYYSDFYCPVVYFDIDDNVYIGKDFFEKSNFKLQAWNKLYRREFLLANKMEFLEGRLHEDVSYTVPLCMCAEKVTAIPYVGYYYRQNRDGSIMATIKEKNVEDFSHALCYAFSFVEERNRSSEYFCQWISSAFFKSCLTHKTLFSVIKKYHLKNKVPGILLRISQLHPTIVNKLRTKCFVPLLFYYHHLIRFRYILGSLIHRRRNLLVATKGGNKKEPMVK